MLTRNIKGVAVILGLVLAMPALAEDGIQIVYQEPLQQLRLSYSMPSGAQKPGLAQLQSLRFDAFGKRFDISLEPNHTLLSAAQRLALDSRLGIYRGEIAGMPDSWARLVVQNEIPRGMFWDGDEMWAIDVAANAASGAGEAVIYRLADLLIAPGMLSCSEVRTARTAGELAKAVLAETLAAMQGPGATKKIEVAVLGDYEFTSAKGASAEADLITRMNNVDGIFSMQLGVQINVNRIDTFASANDPFSDATDSSALLVELSNYRNATPAQNANGLTHLFTGRDLDTTTVGVAYTEALCSRRYGAGLTQGTHSVTMDSLIAAHEMGHNFGAPHDGTAGSACETTPPDFLMAATLNGSDTFSACSITEMQDDVSRASCITALPSTDVALVAGSQPAAVLLGNTTTFTLEANSVGTNTASGVDVGLTIPAAVSLNSVSASSGTCTSGAGTASCAIGSIAAGSGVTVTVDVTAAAVGNADFVANVTADLDANGNNNQATVRLPVNPAVDLVSTAAAAAQISLDQTIAIRPNIENRAPIAASNVSVTVTPDDGIRIDSASWAPGSCNVASNVLTCQAGSLGAGSSELLQIELTGIVEGSQLYAISVSSADADRDMSNNDTSGQISVGNVGGGSNNSGDSGGGSFEWLSLLLLMFVRSSRFRHLRHGSQTD